MMSNNRLSVFEGGLQWQDKLYNTDSVVTGSSNLYITATTEFPDSRWNYDANFVENRTVPANLGIGGSVYVNASLTLASDTAVESGLNVNSNLNLNGYTLTVGGDVWLASGTLNINKGKLYVDGNMNLRYADRSYGYGYLNMTNDEDYVLVNGNMYVEFIDNGLNTHTQYEYYIVALGANGVRSENSNTIKAATDVDAYAPTTPTGLQAVVRADGTVYLTWIASSDNVSVDGYNLYRNRDYIGNATGTAYNDKNAVPGYHEYFVEAYDNEGNNSLFSSSVYADNMPPEKPVLYISEITPMQISFKWNAEDNVEIEHFEIYKNGEFFKNTTSSEYTDTSVTAGNN